MNARADFDANLNRLTGFTIDRVVYFEIDYQNGGHFFETILRLGISWILGSS